MSQAPAVPASRRDLSDHQPGAIVMIVMVGKRERGMVQLLLENIEEDVRVGGKLLLSFGEFEVEEIYLNRPVAIPYVRARQLDGNFTMEQLHAAPEPTGTHSLFWA